MTEGIMPGLGIQDAMDARKPQDRIKDLYDQAAITPALKHNLKQELVQLERTDQLLGSIDPDREEAKELVKKYIAFLEFMG